MKEFNIIADIAGQHNALMRLLDKMPKGPQVVSLGDTVDRGPKSFEVVEFFINNPQHIVLLGNHEHMMLDTLTNGKYYGWRVWEGNGGTKTYESFEKNNVDLHGLTGQKYIEWLKSLPLTLETDNLFLSHAFFANWMEDRGLAPDNYSGYAIEESIIWNRLPPYPMPNKYQVCGHNSQYGLKTWSDEDGYDYATCIDDSRKEKLTGLHWPSMKIFQERY